MTLFLRNNLVIICTSEANLMKYSPFDSSFLCSILKDEFYTHKDISFD